jgi:hypothetical protein
MMSALLLHIPGAENVIADQESRKVRSEIEWALDPPIIHMAVEKIGFQSDIDLFASRLNHKCEKYVSYRPDPGAYAVNAFHGVPASSMPSPHFVLSKKSCKRCTVSRPQAS